jgi:hypothetical protein
MGESRRWDDASRDMLAEANTTPVTKDDLLRIVDEAESSFPDARDLMAYAIAARSFIRDPDKMEAVMLRLKALSRFVSNEGAPGWTVSLPDGVVLTPEPVFAAAAAVQPLIEVSDDVGFDRETFLARVLEIAELKEIG